MPGRISKLRASLLNNKGLKLIALVLAVVCWYAIRRATSIEEWIYDVPLNIQLDEGWAILERSANTVDVKFQGSQQNIMALDRDRTEVQVDIRSRPLKSATRVELEPKHVRALGGARPVLIRPTEIELTLDQEGEVQVPVKVETTGEPPVGYELERAICAPASVTVYGPRQRLKDIESLRTAPVDLAGRTRSFKARLPVQAPSDLWVSRIEPDAVSAEVTIVERSAEKSLEGVRVHALVDAGLGPNVRVTPGKVHIVLSGRSEILDTLRNEDVRAYVDCVGLDSSVSYELPVRVDVPHGLKVVSTEPSTIDVEMGEL